MKICYMCAQVHTNDFEIQMCQNRLLEEAQDPNKQIGLETFVRLDPTALKQAISLDVQFLNIARSCISFVLNELQLRGYRIDAEEMQDIVYRNLIKNVECYKGLTEEQLIKIPPKYKVQIPVSILKTFSKKFFEGIPPDLMAKLPVEVFEYANIFPDQFDPDGAPRNATNRKHEPK